MKTANSADRCFKLRNMNSIHLPSTCAALLMTFGFACASQQKPISAASDCPGPEWTCSQSGPCPFEEFKGSLCAVGTAESISSYSLGMEVAKTRARREMAAVIRSKVDGFVRATQDSLSKAGLGEDATQKVGDLAGNVVEETLPGVMVPKTWYNANSKIYFAVAVIDSKTFTSALKGLRDANGLSETMRQDIVTRAESIVADWQAERDRKNSK